MKNAEELALVKKLEDIVADLPEKITLEDLNHNEWLKRLVLVCDRVTNQVTYNALDWAELPQGALSSAGKRSTEIT